LGQELSDEMKEKRIKKRKTDHIYICLNEDVEAKKITTGFEDIFFIHRALPELNLEEIDLTTEVFGYKFSAPIMISSITGGAEEAIKINASIAEAIEELGLGMGVGSQRAALENPNLRRTYTIVRKKAPNAFLEGSMSPEREEQAGRQLSGTELIKEGIISQRKLERNSGTGEYQQRQASSKSHSLLTSPLSLLAE